MDQKQFDAVLSDAETRLRRLKVLYEQWFMGFERVEPAIPRKELEDLLARLRKETVNNTALRFRLQQLVQRHVTFSTHWRRIGRQIEEGTYQRDLQKARRRAQQGADRYADAPEMEVSYDVDIDVDLADALQEAERAAEAASASVTPPPAEKALASRTFAAPVQFVAQPMAAGAFAGGHAAMAMGVEASGTADGAAAFGGQPAVPRMGAAGAFGAAAARYVTGTFATAEAAPQPSAAGGGSPTPSGGLPVAANTNGLRAANAQRGISPFALPSAGSVRPKALEPPRPPPPPPALTSKMAGAPPTNPRVPLPPPMAAGSAAAGAAGAPKPVPPAIARPRTNGAHAAISAPPAGARAAATQAVVAASPAKSAGAAPPPSAAGAASRAPNGAAGRTSIGAHSAFGAAGAANGAVQAAEAAANGAGRATAFGAAAVRPANVAANGGSPNASMPARPVTSTQPGARASMPGARPVPSAKPAAAAASLSSSDVDRVFTQYLAARKQNAERVDNVKRDTIEKTLRGMLPQLEKKHAGKKIDFEVVVKDGKVALKPVAK